jgi:hypothetical protein
MNLPQVRGRHPLDWCRSNGVEILATGCVTMPTFLIERELPGADRLTPEQLREISAKSNKVVEGLGVPYKWITSYVAGDKIYCVHEAPNAETVLRHAREGGFPANKVSEVAAFIGPYTAAGGKA